MVRHGIGQRRRPKRELSYWGEDEDETLSPVQKRQVVQVMAAFSDVLIDSAGQVQGCEHRIITHPPHPMAGGEDSHMSHPVSLKGCTTVRSGEHVGTRGYTGVP